ncbi:MAG: carbohydrate porin [Marinoscillum sp.]|uniref:carbohydrate porin n=2 Tax=Marinoscillum sp. TaxID=2024838 RepID=UPI0033007CB2
MTDLKNLLLVFCSLTCHLGVAQETSSDILEWEIVYSALPWANLSGGLDQGFVYMDNADVTAKLNVNELFDWEQSMSIFFYGLGNHGGQATDFMGDFQVASNIQAAPSWRLFEVWIQENFLNDRVSALFGLYDLNSEFDVLRPGTIFINSSFGIGAEYAQSGLNGPSIFPISSLGLRLSSSITDQWQVRLAILDGVSGNPANLKSNRIALSKEDGALIAMEHSIYLSSAVPDRINRNYTTRRKKVGRDRDIPTNDKINLGGWMYTAEFPEIGDNSFYQPNWGAYIGAQKYWFYSSYDDRYLSMFVRYGVANDRINRIGSAISGGIVFAGSLSEKTDYVGLAFSTAINGKARLEHSPEDERAETALELTYSFPVRTWLTIQPDVQYIINPNTDASIKNPLAIGLLIQASVGGAW